MYKYLLSLLLICSMQFGFAQVEMATNFRGEGKIYVVIGIIIILLAGFFYLLMRLDNRAKKLEEEILKK